MTTAQAQPVFGRVVYWDLLRFALLALGVGAAFSLALSLLVLSTVSWAQAAPLSVDDQPLLKKSEVTQGSLLLATQQSGRYLAAPVLATTVQMQISGITARVRVSQTFHNPSSQWVEGVYVFPLPENAAVDHLKMRLGQREIEGQIKEKQAARTAYDKAKQAGQHAALVEQERPNIFTTSVANLGPGQDVTVMIEYQQAIACDQGVYSLRFPMVVAPRYIPGTPLPQASVANVTQHRGWAQDSDQVPDASRITPPVLPPNAATADAPVLNPVRLDIDLDAGFALAKITSPYHTLNVVQESEQHYHISLSAGSVPANKDFELVWAPQPGVTPQAAVFTEHQADKTYALMMLMPPLSAELGQHRLPRETVFIIDTSGSMQGTSLDQAKQALLLALERLQAEDTFNVIQFNSVTERLFSQVVAADVAHIAQAKTYVQGLQANGGTEMYPALSAALQGQEAPGRVRQVIFITDGAVGNEEALFQLIHQQLGDRRLFTLGIGSAPNSYFMSKAAEFGRGSFTYIGKVQEVGEKMATLFTKLESPVLSQLQVDFPQGMKVEISPAKLPDLYSGEPLIFSAAISGDLPAYASLTVRGMRGTTPWQANLKLEQQGFGAVSPGIHVLWARRKIQSLLDSVHSGADSEAVRQEVIELALAHHLVSPYTSLVAVDVTPARAQHEALSENLPIANHLPEGWDYAAVFGELPQTATPAQWQILWGTLFLALAVMLYSLRRRTMLYV